MPAVPSPPATPLPAFAPSGSHVPLSQSRPSSPPLTHLDLFSGLGGFALAARWTGGIETVAFCDSDPFCQSVLARHWPHVPLFTDIHALTPTSLAERGVGSIDLVTGGFPCQPFSVAGRKRGVADPRHLWPQMRRVLAEVRPRLVVGENVAHFVRLALDGCLFDLEALGYRAWTLILPACALGAPHRRERAFLLAEDADCCTRLWPTPLASHWDWKRDDGRRHQVSLLMQVWAVEGALAPTPEEAQRTKEGVLNPAWVERLMGFPEGWDGDAWLEASRRAWEDGTWERGIARLVADVPGRSRRLKALGNAVVPQVVYPLLRALVKQRAIELSEREGAPV